MSDPFTGGDRYSEEVQPEGFFLLTEQPLRTGKPRLLLVLTILASAWPVYLAARVLFVGAALATLFGAVDVLLTYALILAGPALLGLAVAGTGAAISVHSPRKALALACTGFLISSCWSVLVAAVHFASR